MTKPTTMPPVAEETGSNVSDLLERIQATLAQARRTAESSSAALGSDPAPEATGYDRTRELEQRLASIEAERARLADQLAEVEGQTSHLIGLHVATHQLHGTFGLEEVQDVLADVLTNLVGVRSFVLLRDHEGRRGSEVARVHGVTGAEWAPEASELEHDLVVAAARRTGAPSFAPGHTAPVLAAIPLAVGPRPVGLLAVLRLLPHRRALAQADRELLALLALHAASALRLAQLESGPRDVADPGALDEGVTAGAA